MIRSNQCVKCHYSYLIDLWFINLADSVAFILDPWEHWRLHTTRTYFISYKTTAWLINWVHYDLLLITLLYSCCFFVGCYVLYRK